MGILFLTLPMFYSFQLLCHPDLHLDMDMMYLLLNRFFLIYTLFKELIEILQRLHFHTFFHVKLV